MCGICGILVVDPGEAARAGQVDLERDIQRMTAALVHRGPDGSGVHVEEGLALGATRLAIQDPTPAAAQPMRLAGSDDRTRARLVFNGEIYNFVELRAEMERHGERFQSRGDTEVLLRWLARRGPEGVGSLRGMFAFAFWDAQSRRLHLVRDRLGEKPLVYCRVGGVFAFASEIQALLTLPWLPREVDTAGVLQGFHFVTVPAPYSAFRHIRKLSPATHLAVAPGDAEPRLERYWRPEASLTLRSADECEEAIRERLGETLSLMARSDRPLGAMLSGGIDSGAVTAGLARALDRPAETYCVSHEFDTARGEFAAAARVAAHVGAHHHEVPFHSGGVETAPHLVRAYAEPVCSFVPLHADALAGLMSRNLTVALTGSGGDELFGGYPDHAVLMWRDRRRRQWEFLDAWGMARAAGRLPISRIRNSFALWARTRGMTPGALAAERRLGPARSFCQAVFHRDALRALEADPPAARFQSAYGNLPAGSADPLFGFSAQQLVLGSQHGLVDIPDLSGMAHGLEYRSPFLDVRMVELGLSIPARLKVTRATQNLGGKAILRRALRGMLPPDILSRPKIGFGGTIPYAQWFCRDWAPEIEARLSAPALADSKLVDVPRVKELYRLAQAGHPAPLEHLWGIVMLSYWLEAFF